MLKSILRNLLFARGAGSSPTLEDAKALMDAGRLEEAESLLQRLFVAMPVRFEPRYLLARLLYGQQRFAPAAAILEQTLPLAPKNADVLYLLGRARIDLGAFAEATTALRRSLELEPASALAWLALGDAAGGLGDPDRAEDHYRRALELMPSLATAAYNYGNLLVATGRVDEALLYYRRALELKPQFRLVHSNFVYALNLTEALPPDAVFAAHLEWAARHAEPLSASAAAPARGRQCAGPLRVGYVSANFRDHAVTYFFEPVLRHHDPGTFSIFCYSDVEKPDRTTERLRRYRCSWRDTATLSEEALADLVRRDGIDILVDLSGHTRGNRLLTFARKPAPVQITWNGYANTTGLSAIDYRITDAYADPPGTTERLHTERLLRMPEIYMPFEKPEDDLPLSAPPALGRGYVTFGSFNVASKVTARTLNLWARILQGTPSSRLLMLGIPAGRTRERIAEAFASAGVDTSHLELRERVPHSEFMAAHHEVDIALDTFPQHGTTTTAHTLWMGVPVVTLAGTTHASRVGVSMLSNAGLARMIAGTDEEYVRIACELAADVACLTQLRASLRNDMLKAPNMDGSRFTHFLESAYLRISA